MDPQNVRVASDMVSRQHVRLRTSADGLIVEDAGSCGGFYLDDQRVQGPVPIRPGMRLQLNSDVVYTLREFTGESLWDVLYRGPLPLDTGLRMAGDVLRGLVRLHDQDRCHGGLSPHEILCAVDGSFTLLVQGWTVITDGVLNCNPAYSAPESFCEGRLEPATDVYALGLIVFEALTGRRPYSTDLPQINMMTKLRGPSPEPEPGWSDALREWLASAMQVDPRLRPSARQSLDQLAELGA
jgi:serine/threonine protein kinase